MRNKKLFGIVLTGLIISICIISGKTNTAHSTDDETTEIAVETGTIQNIVSATGTMLPQNRLEIKPPVSGRVEKILVREGATVAAGEIVATMSSTERATMLDAAREQGADTFAYWENVYKPISLIAPIDGEVIVATIQPGQTVATSDAVIVLSDRLIIRAQVDETDIGKIKVDQNATIIIDAYPDTHIRATVGHIYYESTTLNNVTMYKVDLFPETVLPFFRSGMNATVDFITGSAENTLMLPITAVETDPRGASFVFIKGPKGEPIRQPVTLGISDDKNVEITSGITASDTIIRTSTKYALPKSSTEKNPFMPQRRQQPRNR